VKVVPAPGFETTPTLPPWACMTESTIDKPSPLPSWLVRWRDGSALKKRSKILF
jgi:hypothetical protein